LPVYEYRCSGGHQYEKTEGFHAPTQHACPHCGKKALRQISVPAVIFKGSGFYSTDNRKSGGSNGRSSSFDTETSSSSHSGNGDHGHSHTSQPEVEARSD